MRVFEIVQNVGSRLLYSTPSNLSLILVGLNHTVILQTDSDWFSKQHCHASNWSRLAQQTTLSCFRLIPTGSVHHTVILQTDPDWFTKQHCHTSDWSTKPHCHASFWSRLVSTTPSYFLLAPTGLLNHTVAFHFDPDWFIEPQWQHFNLKGDWQKANTSSTRLIYRVKRTHTPAYNNSLSCTVDEVGVGW